ncbi:kinase-like protein [Trichoderma longibrachiatum ATCC 18648]|uniref:non-specific serine/threonine protein kinase n=1 Tax=Trichoderma longibrachiatum ATCC 18648 TaxID=983965 RepID=A0A2T4CJ14_TRILO|nr:kinase-like protein [Trichoderma longibrachiatum ATCC 18648]
MAQILADLFYSFGNCLNCFPGSPTLKINSRSFKIQRLLGEGGFSYVYLVEDTSTHELFALKKIRCPFGAESVQQAMREVDAYRLFDHVPTIISAYDHCVATERGSGGGGDDDAGKTVYVLLPYYRRGNLQDMINANLVNHGRFPERHLMMLFLGVCKALRAMHEYQPAPAERMQMGREEDQDHDHDDTTAAAATSGGAGSRSGRKMGTRGKRTEEQEQGEQERPLMEQGSRLEGESGGKIKSYAHRDIKPGNIMIDDSGSLRSDETGGTLSLCVLGGDWRFPDEKPGGGGGGPKRANTIQAAKAKASAGETGAAAGGSSSSGDVSISEPIRNLVRACLKVEPAERPDINELIAMVEQVIDELPDGDFTS